jgi:hypothetical protein
MEKITLTVPELVPAIQTSDYTPDDIFLSRRQRLILVKFFGTNGEVREWKVEGQLALDRLKALNTANLSTKSLYRRCMELAIADGVFEGAVTGAPDA